jgi:hypothetical protein
LVSRLFNVERYVKIIMYIELENVRKEVVMASLKDGLKNLEKFCQDSWHRPGTS